MSTDIERSLKDKIRNLSKESGVTFNTLWQALILERFLARLSRSPNKLSLVFKGGMLLSYYLPLGRETTDLDFTIFNSSGEKAVVEKLIQDVASIELDDGFTFALLEIIEVDHLQTPYPGYLVGLLATCGNTKSKLFLDVGIGDVVSPTSFSVRLLRSSKGPIFEPEISLTVYPPEYIFAEKLETACARGTANSRMKDFHDLWAMTRLESSLKLDLKKLLTALQNTFNHRGTKLTAIPMDSDYFQQEKYWSAHIRGLKKSGLTDLLPPKFKDVVTEINDWLKTQLDLN